MKEHSPLNSRIVGRSTYNLRTPAILLLLITLLPFFCQLGFVFWLTAQFSRAQTETNRASHARQLASESFQLMWDSFLTLYVATLYADLENFLDVDTMRDTSAKLAKRLAVLLELTEGDPQQNKEVVAVDKAIRIMKAATVQTQMNRSSTVNEPPYEIVYSETKKYVAAINNLLAIETAKLAHNQIEVQELRSSVQWAFMMALPLCFVQFAVLGFLYQTGISRPLQRISENGKRLSKRFELLPALSSADEIGELDRVIHAVSDSVNEALATEEWVLRSAGDLICSINEDLVFIKLNPHALKMFGLRPDELIGKSITEFVLPDCVTLATQRLSEARSSFKETEIELTIRRVDDTIIDTRWSVFWSESENCFFCVAHDITEEKKIEKLKKDFLDKISQDLRSPLMSILESITLVESGEKGPIPEALQRDAKTNRQSIKRLILLIDDLLDFQNPSGQLHLNIEKVKLLEVVSDAVEMVDKVAEASGISLEISCENLVLNADRGKVIQVLVNLFSNAIKFSPEGSSITVSSCWHDDFVEISVTDCGLGVPEGFNQKIFEPFGQAPSTKAEEGTGLGLAICKMIIEAHGGAMGVRTPESGVGSTFWFRIAATPPQF